MSKGGNKTQTTKVEIDPALRKQGLQNIDLANALAQLGPMLYGGNTVAGFSPMQVAAMQGTDQTASAFGMPSAVDWQQGADGQMAAPQGMDSNAMFRALTGMAPPTKDKNGVSGYSGMGGFEQQLAQMPAAQRRLLESFWANPHTGAPATNPALQGRNTGGKPGGSSLTSKMRNIIDWQKQYGGR